MSTNFPQHLGWPLWTKEGLLLLLLLQVWRGTFSHYSDKMQAAYIHYEFSDTVRSAHGNLLLKTWAHVSLGTSRGMDAGSDRESQLGLSLGTMSPKSYPVVWMAVGGKPLISRMIGMSCAEAVIFSRTSLWLSAAFQSSHPKSLWSLPGIRAVVLRDSRPLFPHFFYHLG